MADTPSSLASRRIVSASAPSASSSASAVSSTASRSIVGGRPRPRELDLSPICCTCRLIPMAHGTPTFATGKICYLEIPATDIECSSRFYRDAFRWELRTRGDGAIAFNDAVGEVSGTWVTGRAPSAEPGIMVYIMVADL